MSEQKTTYKNLVTVPGAATDSIVSTPNTGVGGDIVANFKKIADVINPQGTTSGCQALNVGCNFNAGYPNNPQGVMYHILNNNAHGVDGYSLAPGGSWYAFPSDSSTANGICSGAFIKGVLFDAQCNFPTSTGYKLFDVPYMGCIFINMQVIICDSNSGLHVATGNLVVYPLGVQLQGKENDENGTGFFDNSDNTVSIILDSDGRVLLKFSVLNGALFVNLGPNGSEWDLRIVQIGMHGTILVGVEENINMSQTSGQVMPGWGSSS